jgi:hypothetical protein
VTNPGDLQQIFQPGGPSVEVWNGKSRRDARFDQVSAVEIRLVVQRDNDGLLDQVGFAGIQIA